MRDRTDRAIGRVALGVSVVLVLGVAATAWLAVRQPSTPAPAYRVGEHVELPNRLYKDHAATLVIVVKAGCPACERSEAFHQSLQEAAIGAGVGVQWLHADQAPAADLGRVRVAPSVLLINRQGIVLAIEEGALPDAEQRALMERVRRAY